MASSATVLKIFNFMIYGSIAIFNTFFPLYLQSIGISHMAIGMLLAGGPLVSVIANPFWGYWSDRLRNIKRTVIIMLIINLLIAQVVFQLHTYSFLYVGMILFYFFQMPLYSQSNSLILNAIEGTTYKFGSIRLWGSLGWAVIAVAAGPLLTWIGIEKLWLPYSIGIVITLLFTILLPQGESRGGTAFSNSGYKEVFKNTNFVLFVLLGVLISIPNSMNGTFSSIYITSLGGSEILVGWSIFLASVFEAPIFLLFDKYLKRTKVAMVAVMGVVSLLFSIRWLLMSMVDSPIAIILIQGMHCITFGGYFYVGTQLTASMVPKAYRASGQAAFALTWGGVSGFFAGFFGGWIFENLGPQLMYVVGSGLSLLGVVGFLLLWLRLRNTTATAYELDQIQ